MPHNSQSGFFKKALALILGGGLAFAAFHAVRGLERVPSTALDVASLPDEYLFTESAWEKAIPPAAEVQFRFDPVALLVRKPDYEATWEWEEHPDGGFTVRSNNLGFTEVEPTLLEKTGIRILVSGDSHTQGLIGPERTFANLLEARLGESEPDVSYEVINAGVAYTGPRGYLGMLRRCLPLKPDLFIAALFTGNDFWDEHRLELARRGEPLPRVTPAYMQRVGRAKEVKVEALYQGFNQSYRFKHRPEDERLAFALAVRSYQEMWETCREEGIGFLALIIPTKVDVDLEDDRETFEAMCEALAMTPEEAGLNRRLGDEFVAAMRERGIPCLDPTPAMIAETEPLYWQKDHHLGWHGHALVAEELLEAVRGMLDR